MLLLQSLLLLPSFCSLFNARLLRLVVTGSLFVLVDTWPCGCRSFVCLFLFVSLVSFRVSMPPL